MLRKSVSNIENAIKTPNPQFSMRTQAVLAATTSAKKDDVKTRTSIVLVPAEGSSTGEDSSIEFLADKNIAVMMVTAKSAIGFTMQTLGTIYPTAREGDQTASNERTLFEVVETKNQELKAVPGDIGEFWVLKQAPDLTMTQTEGSKEFFELAQGMPDRADELRVEEEKERQRAATEQQKIQGERLKEGYSKEGEGAAAGYSMDDDGNVYPVSYKGPVLNDLRDRVRFGRRVMGKLRFAHLAAPEHYLGTGKDALERLRLTFATAHFGALPAYFQKSLELMEVVDQFAITKYPKRDASVMGGSDMPSSMDYKMFSVMDFRQQTSGDNVQGKQFANMGDLNTMVAALRNYELYAVARFNPAFKGVCDESIELLRPTQDSPFLSVAKDVLRFQVERVVFAFHSEVANNPISDTGLPLKEPEECAALLKHRLKRALSDTSFTTSDRFPHHLFYRPNGIFSRIKNPTFGGGGGGSPSDKEVKGGKVKSEDSGEDEKEEKREKKKQKKNKEERKKERIKEEAVVKKEGGGAGRGSRGGGGAVNGASAAESKESDGGGGGAAPRATLWCANHIAGLCGIKGRNGSIVSCSPTNGKVCSFVHPDELKEVPINSAKNAAQFLSRLHVPEKRQIGLDLGAFIDGHEDRFAA